MKEVISGLVLRHLLYLSQSPFLVEIVLGIIGNITPLAFTPSPRYACSFVLIVIF